MTTWLRLDRLKEYKEELEYRRKEYMQENERNELMGQVINCLEEAYVLSERIQELEGFIDDALKKMGYDWIGGGCMSSEDPGVDCAPCLFAVVGPYDMLCDDENDDPYEEAEYEDPDHEDDEDDPAASYEDSAMEGCDGCDMRFLDMLDDLITLAEIAELMEGIIREMTDGTPSYKIDHFLYSYDQTVAEMLARWEGYVRAEFMDQFA